MKLLDEFVAGIRGAEGGTVEVYRRGTSTKAVLYQDLEAKLATLESPITLDAYGRAVFYVNEMVSVHVFTEAGAELLAYNVGEQATDVEVISSKFTGTDYETAEEAVAKPTLLITVLEALQASIEGLTSDVADVAGLGIVYNVKDPAYGAEGDGITNDYAAITAAIAAAVADGGGIVFFPAGTYYIETGLAVGGTVHLWGAGSNCTEILAEHSIATAAVTITPTVTEQDKHIDVSGLRIEADDTQGTHGALEIVGSTHGAHISVHGCALNRGRHFKAGIVATGSGTTVVAVHDCDFVCGTRKAIEAYGASAPTVFLGGCRLRHYGTTMSVDDVLISRGIVSGCMFDNSGLVSPTDVANVHVPVDSAGPVALSGNLFTAPEAVTATSFAIWGEESVVVESGNNIDPSLVVILHMGTVDSTHRQMVGSRGYRTRDEQGNATAQLMPQDWHTEDLLIDGDITILLGSAPPGTQYAVVIENLDSSTHTITWTGDFGGDRTVGAGYVGLILFRQTICNGQGNWAAYSSTYSWTRPT